MIISYIYRQQPSMWRRETSRPRSWSLSLKSTAVDGWNLIPSELKNARTVQPQLETRHLLRDPTWIIGGQPSSIPQVYQLIISYIHRQQPSMWWRETSRPRSWSPRWRSNSRLSHIFTGSRHQCGGGKQAGQDPEI